MIVEPVAGSAGVLLPPKGYLQRLRQICDKHGILLIFDEVITGFGRLGAAFGVGLFRRDAGHHDDRQGADQRRHPDGRRVREEEHLRGLHERPRARDRVLPRLHLLRQPGVLRGEPRDARHLSARGPAHPRLRDGEALGGCAVQPEGPAARHRHPRDRPGRRGRARADRGRAGEARLQRLPAILRAGHHDPHDRRHHRHVAAADHSRRARSTS